MNKPNQLTLLNIIIPIILFIILNFTTKIDEQIISIITITLFIGYLMPYFVLLITGICMLTKTHYRLSLIINILNIILSLMFIILIASIINKNLIVMLITYIIIAINSIINIIYLIVYFKKYPNLENIRIKEKKQKNNGAIV